MHVIPCLRQTDTELFHEGGLIMRKYIFSLVLIMVTAGFVFVSLGTTLDAPPAQVRIVSVERGDVHKVVAICGQLGYRDEQLLFAASNGKADASTM